VRRWPRWSWRRGRALPSCVRGALFFHLGAAAACWMRTTLTCARTRSPIAAPPSTTRAAVQVRCDEAAAAGLLHSPPAQTHPRPLAGVAMAALAWGAVGHCAGWAALARFPTFYATSRTLSRPAPEPLPPKGCRMEPAQQAPSSPFNTVIQKSLPRANQKSVSRCTSGVTISTAICAVVHCPDSPATQG
jgi:hypothetical protein